MAYSVTFADFDRSALAECITKLQRNSSHYGRPHLGEAIKLLESLQAADTPTTDLPDTHPVAVAHNTATAITGLAVEDADTAGTFTLLVSGPESSTVTFADNVGSGLVGGDITDNGSATVVVEATVTKINATLADGSGLMYTPPTDSDGEQNVTISITDPQGNVGTVVVTMDVAAA